MSRFVSFLFLFLAAEAEEKDGASAEKRPRLEEALEEAGGGGGGGDVIAGRPFRNLDQDLDELPLEELRDILKEVDPVSWRMRHDGDRRKIQR